MGLPANIVCLALNPGLEYDGGAGVNIFTNLWTNPSFEYGVTSVTANGGSGGTAAITQVTSPLTPFHGTHYAQCLWSAASGSPTGGIDFAAITVATGRMYVSAYVKVGSGGAGQQNLVWSFTGTAAFTTQSNPAHVAAAADGWYRMEAFLTITTAGTLIAHLGGTTGTGSHNWSVGASLNIDGVMMVPGTAYSLPYGDGDDFVTATVGWGWTGAPPTTSVYQSGNYQNGYNNFAASGGAIEYAGAAHVRSGLNSLHIMATGAANPGCTMDPLAFTNGTVITCGCWVYWPSQYGAPLPITLTLTGGLAASTTVTPAADTWTQIIVTGTTTSATATTMAVKCTGTPPPGATYMVDDLTANEGTNTASFNGDMAPDSNYRYYWDGAEYGSTSEAEYRGLWLEEATGAPCKAMQITVSGLGLTATEVTVQRTADNETWTVPGWFNRKVTDADTETDFAIPLGRPVTYTMFVNGVQFTQQTITLASTCGYVQDPYDPTSAMPVNTILTDTNVLTLGKGALDSRTHVSNATKATVMGAKRQYSISGQRLADGSVIMLIHAWKNTVSDQFKAMSEGAPILLFRGLPSWGSIPGLAYMDGPVQEYAVNRYQHPGNNNALTQWTITGDLVQAVSRLPITGKATYDQVAAEVAGATYATVQGRSGSRHYLDIQANPLTL
jgi:hypothetical protein